MPPKTTNNKNIKQKNTSKNDVFLQNNNSGLNNESNTSENIIKTEVASTQTKTIEQKYQKKTHLEHILLRPDTYIGPIMADNASMWVYDSDLNKIVKKDIEYVPGLYKIFDEILVNARDHSCDDSSCDTIKVNIEKETNTITVWNNGNGIDVAEHAEHKMYVPEMIFGEFLTSTNYDDEEKRTTGGRNGYGAKLTNAFSTFFSVETIDGERKLKFYQEFTNNLSSRTKPKVTQLKAEKPITYTKITFQPDLAKFKLTELTDDMVGLMSRRVFDIAGVSNKLKVYLNDKKIEANNFKKYIGLYQLFPETTNSDSDSDSDNDEDVSDTEAEVTEPKQKLIYEESGKWKVGVMYIPDYNFEQISFVNGISTFKGGIHVDLVMKQIIDKLKVNILKKFKEAKVKDNAIKDNLVIFLDCEMFNPAFGSQTKETLTKTKDKNSEFTSQYVVSDKFIKQLNSTGIVDQIVNLAKLKEESFLKKTDGKKTASVKGIPKLEDANFAGTKKSIQCSLILTEGDSAKALAMAGLSVVGSDYYGVFPLKGKLLNVREATAKQLLENEEINNINKILGLAHGKEYTDLSDLRYGRIILMCDQDLDGFHIKGLLINFIHYFWPSLLMHDNFITTLSTPIVKATKSSGKKDIKEFYNLTEYEQWKQLPESANYKIKYYKGLGTSTRDEAKEYFKNIETKLIKYTSGIGNYEENEEDINELAIGEKSELVEYQDQVEETDLVDPEQTNLGDQTNLGEQDQSEQTDLEQSDLVELEQTETKKKKCSKSPNKNTEAPSLRDLYYKRVGKNSRKIFGVTTRYENDTTEAMTLAFEKKRADCRKIWLKNYNRLRVLSNSVKKVPIADFIHKELIHFSNDDNDRSLASVVDGLKPSTRKILYAAFLKKMNTPASEIKVAQFAGFVSEKTSYHHGEASLFAAIIGMAQDFMGSNNINLLHPSGQFGTRHAGGKDSASPRYIFTCLASLTRLIFREDDDPILNYLDDDGTLVEPEWYCPIIPMVLVNGTEGIGTGFSTTVCQFNPLDIVENIKLLIQSKPPKPLIPFYRNFKGTIQQTEPNKYSVTGCYQKMDSETIIVTELPVGVWTNSYKEFLEKKSDKKNDKKKSVQLIESYKSNNTDDSICFTIKMEPNNLSKLESSNKIWTKLKLQQKISLTNMHLHNSEGHIKKYKNPNEILLEFYETRLMMYTKRKEYLIRKLSKELDILKWKKLFIEYVLDNKIVIYKQKKDNIIAKLVELGFPKLATETKESNTDKNNSSYDYVTEMKLFNLTEEKIAELTEKYNNKEKELRHVEVTTETEQWIVELDEFVNAYKIWEKNNQCLTNENIPKIKAALAKPVNVKPAGFKTIVPTNVSKAKTTTKTTKPKK
jgi:DNA topoisomerase-2